jgi:Fe-S cluster assembly protein SufB
VAFTNHKMQADTGTKMIHVGRNTRSTIVSKGISAGESVNTYRGLVQILPTAPKTRATTPACDSMLIGTKCSANTFPVHRVENHTAIIEHEATTSTISEDQLFYLQSRGISEEDATSLVVNGFCKDVFKQLPLEFSVEAIKLLEIKLEGSVG